MSSASRRRDLDAEARKLGFEPVRLTGSGHIIYRNSKVKTSVVVASSAGDVRGPKNAIALMRRLVRQAEQL